MEVDFNNNEVAMANIEEALSELFDAEAILDKICAELPQEAKAAIQRVRGRVGKASGLLDRPWPMIDANTHVPA